MKEKSKTKIVIVFLLFFSNHQIFAAKKCKDVFSENASIANTDEFLLYFDSLLSQNLVSFEEFERWGRLLNQDKLTNPLPLLEFNQARFVHAEGLEGFLNKNMDIKIIQGWFKRRFKTLKSANKEKSVVEKLTSLPYSLIFQPIPSGTFGQIHDVFSTNQNGVSLSCPRVRRVTLTHSFEFMDTLVTQLQYASLMHENPSKHNQGGVIKIKGNRCQSTSTIPSSHSPGSRRRSLLMHTRSKKN